MDRRSFFIAAAALIGAAAAAGSAEAAMPTLAPLQQDQGPPVTEVKKGGQGRGNRGRHLGWSRGRGRAVGRKRKFGF